MGRSCCGRSGCRVFTSRFQWTPFVYLVYVHIQFDRISIPYCVELDLRRTFRNLHTAFIRGLGGRGGAWWVFRLVWTLMTRDIPESNLTHFVQLLDHFLWLQRRGFVSIKINTVLSFRNVITAALNILRSKCLCKNWGYNMDLSGYKVYTTRIILAVFFALQISKPVNK